MNGAIKRACAAILCLSAVPISARACTSCGCTLDTDAATGYSTMPGWRLNIEYDYIHQDQLRSGKHAISAVPDGFELERETLNRYYTVGLDYSPNANWNVSLRLPYVARTHSTYGTFESTRPRSDSSESRSSSLGDIKLIGSYQGFLPAHNLGVQLGVKLPTGPYGTDVTFSGGPLARAALDASLQPGTGSTDVIIGAYFYQAVGQDFNVFVDGQFQSAVTSRQHDLGNDYRPGNSTTLSFGLRYVAHPKLIPQLQMNLLHKSVDQGALADNYSTAGYVAYISPGLTARVTQNMQVYGFVQIPVYSDLVGYQLFPRYSFTIGGSYAF